MEPITGTLAVVDKGKDTVLPVQDHDAYFNGATGLHQGIDVLGSPEPRAYLALAFLCGQAAECYLKAVLSHAGFTTKQLRELSHNLLPLWDAAASNAALTPVSPPLWVQHLADVHQSPYPLRYPKGHGVVLPVMTNLVQELADLRSFAKARLGR